MRQKTNKINVRDYGAVGDGLSDDTPAFDAALLAMQNIGSSRGNKLVIPNGTFRLTHELNVECNCVIEGSGVGAESAGTILFFDPAGKDGYIGCHGVIINSERGSAKGGQAGWTIIRDLTIWAARPDSAWLLSNSLKSLVNRNGFIARTRFKLENVNILEFTGNGVHIVTGDGNNSDGNALWHPAKPYTVGDWVMEPGFSKQLMTSVAGSLSLEFNPQGSGDLGNIYTVLIKRNHSIAWSNTPDVGDTLIIPADSILATNDGDNPNANANAGAYIVLGPPQNAPAPSSTSFWAEKYANDPFIASNGIKKNPVTIGEIRLDYFGGNGGAMTGNVSGNTSGAAGTGAIDHGTYVVLASSSGGFVAGDVLHFSGGGIATAGGIQYLAVDMKDTTDIQTFSRLENRYACSVSGMSSQDGEGPGEVRLNYHSNNVPGLHSGKVKGVNSGAEATILRDNWSPADGCYVVITHSSRAFQNDEPLIFSSGSQANSGEFRLNYLGTGGTHIGDNITGGQSGATGTVIDDHGSNSFLVFVPVNHIAFVNNEPLIFSGANPGVATTKSDQTVAKGTQYHCIGSNLPDDQGALGTARWTQTSSSTPNDMGNANNFLVEYVRAAGCGGHGMFIEGDNVNAGTSVAFDASLNDGWGLYDSSFLGNTHIGPHVASNRMGSYRTANHGNAHNVFIGCYSEQDSPPSKIYNPGITLGGIMAAQFADDSNGFRLDGNGMTPHSVTVSQPDLQEIRLNYSNGAGVRSGTVIQGGVRASVLSDNSTQGYLEITSPMGGDFVDGIGLTFSLGGTAVARGSQYFPFQMKDLTTTIGRSSVAGGVFGGIEFTHSDDGIGVLLGSFNRPNQSWGFGRINYGTPAFAIEGNNYANYLRLAGLIIQAGHGRAGLGQYPGCMFAAVNGYPLKEGYDNSFPAGTIVLNQNTGLSPDDNSKGWIAAKSCGSGHPWTAGASPIYPRQTITPSANYITQHPDVEDFVYIQSSNGPGSTGGTEPDWPTAIGHAVIDGNITWLCFGSKSNGLEEIVTRTPTLPDSTLTPGNVTQNSTRGRVALAAAITTKTLTVTNSKITPNSCIYATLQTIDITCNQIIAIVPDSGEFTIYFNNPATAPVNVCWKLEE